MSCDEKLTWKRGDTFYVSALYKADDVNPTDLTSYTINSQIRDAQHNLISTLTITKADSQTTTGKGMYTLKCDTSDWPIATLYWDVEYQIGEIVQSTETKKIVVVIDITQ